MSGWPTTPTGMIRELVPFDTTSSRSNLALIQFVEEYLRSHGIQSRRVADHSGGKANLFATVGPPVAGGVVLSGHTDVVPVAGQDWDTDPFVVVERAGRLYGRGTADMKSFLGAVLAMVPEFLAAGLARPVHLALSYDEEVGCLGVRRLLPTLVESGLDPAAVVVGEPTSMEVVNAHKGVRAFRTTVYGRQSHSSATHRGVNAIMIANKLLGFLRSIAREKAESADPGSEYDPPHATINVGTISGGTALNIVPRRCEFVWEYRPLPSDDSDEIRERFDRFVTGEYLPALRAEGVETTIETEQIATVPPFRTVDASSAETLALRLAGHNRAHVVSYTTEAGLFRDAGFDVVVCGPGDIADAHRPNESIALSQIAACVRFLHRLADRLAHPESGGGGPRH